MKKLIIAILALAICLTSMVVLSEEAEIDLAGMSDEELILLNEALQQEMKIRNVADTVMISDGSYEAGIDIKVGRYIIWPIQVSKGHGHIFVIIDDEEGDGVHGKMFRGDDRGTFAFTLKEGYTLTIEYGSCIIEEENFPLAP